MRNVKSYQELQQVFEEQSFCLDPDPQSFCYLFIALSITRCSKSAQKFAVMATTQLVLNQFSKNLPHQLHELNEVYLYQK